MNGHIVRMDQGRTLHEIFESKPEGSRRGRPRLRWMEDVERIYGRRRLRDGNRRQSIGKNVRP